MRTNTLVTILLQSCNNLALVLYLPTTFDVKNHKLSHLKSSCFTNLVKFKIVRKILQQSCNNPAGCRIVWNLEIGRYLILVPYFHQNKGLMQNPPLNLISYFKWKIYFLKLLIRKKILCTLLYDQVKANQIC